MSKKCPKCKIIKPLSEFHKRGGGRSGYASYCKRCANEATKKFFKTEKGKAARKRANQSDAGKAARKKYDKGAKGKAKAMRLRKSEKYKANKRESAARYRGRFPEKIKAQSAVYYAVDSGKIPQPSILQCKHCDKRAIEYHHHKGYKQEYWLDVVPTCQRCHTAQHTNYHGTTL